MKFKLALPIAAAVALAATAAVRADESLSQISGLTVGITVVVNPNGSLSVHTVGGPYDGSDDTLVTVTNDSGSALLSLSLTSSADIFGFDGDGISSYTGLASDPSGYGSPDSTFSYSSYYAGTVFFGADGISANGGTDYFSLEEAPNISGDTTFTPSAVPDGASTVGMLGIAFLSLSTLRRRFLRR